MSPRIFRPGGRSRRGRLLILLAIPALAVSLLSAAPGSGPAAASPATTPSNHDQASAAADFASLLADVEPVAVTLITGDTVLWSGTGDGEPRMKIERAPREAPVEFDQYGSAEDFYVIPSDVMPHVVDGTLDRELFNVPSLIRQGLDDESTGGELPVIVTFDDSGDAKQLEQDANALPAARGAQGVESIQGAGVNVDRDKAARFRDAVLGKSGKQSRGPSTNTESDSLAGAVETIMLDRMLEVDLDESVPQIGAPQAWEAGFTGEGVTVAVLDTGLDATHPDLQGQVIAAENFVGEGEPIDDHGHGTHVASTIAGTGAASDGQYTGVAPDADLVSGKVCDAEGLCPMSAVMAGMEWAAVDQGADVVNMSLGDEPTDGTDLGSQLVNQLSAETGTLFVTSAGNSGCTDRNVGSPAAADAALAVGAVDKSDRWAGFSSCGPRVGDAAVKPEITAPGKDIVAARAAGTSIGTPADENYTSLQGTSMAAPHTAGAAALLAQAHPNLSGQQLKDALVSTAADVGFALVQQGTGRVDVPAALNSPVYAQGTLNFGGVDGQAERDLVYTNRSDSDISLTLDAWVGDRNNRVVDAATVAMSTNTLTVPAHGQASVTVTVTLDTSSVDSRDSFGGIVTATGGGVELRTGFGFGPPLHRVTIEVLDSHGDRIGTDTAPDQWVDVTLDSADPATAREASVHDLIGTSGGIAVTHVPSGTHSFYTSVEELSADNPLATVRWSMLVELELKVDSDISVTLDARQAVKVEQPTVPHKVQKRNLSVSLIRELPYELSSIFGGPLFVGGGSTGSPVFVTPTPPAKRGTLSLLTTWTLAEPQPLQPIPGKTAEDCPRLLYYCLSDTPTYIYNLPILYENGIPADLHEKFTRRDLVEVPTRFHAEHSDAHIEQFFKVWVFGSTGRGGGQTNDVWINFRPGQVTEYFLADDRIGWNRAVGVARPPNDSVEPYLGLWSHDWFPAAEAGARRTEERWHAGPTRVGTWDVREDARHWPGELKPKSASGIRGGPDGNLFAVPFDVMDNNGHSGESFSAATRRMWNLDTGTELQSLENGGRVFPLAPETARYRLEQIEEYAPSAAAVFRTGPATTTWTFTSRPPQSGTQVPPPYRCYLRDHLFNPTEPWSFVCPIQPLIMLDYNLDLDIRNRARAGRAHVFTITAGHHSKAIDRAEITDLSVQASFDDGDTWTEARVVGKPKDSWDTGGFLPSAEPDQQYRVVLKVPPLHRTNGFVALRVQAEDANGGTVEQTIQRAFILKR